ncbi:MAG TPA: low molecular weight phosphotyrosine protein phosphatase, partial [Bacteroidia bacterium]|nr:low molecular weight phosphotyrosine protein phosphatase [Bacteroidia bacterium]
MKTILMVCLGNICRSPLAEGVLRHKLSEAGLNDIQVDSAGTASYHVVAHPDQRSIKIARSHGIDISGLRARKFT